MRVRDLVQALHPGVAGLMGALNRLATLKRPEEVRLVRRDGPVHAQV
jgi:hypothetical protein